MLKHLVSTSRAQCARPPVRNSAAIVYRFQSTQQTPWRKDTTPEPSVFVEENFAKHTLFVLNVARRMLKFTFIGITVIGTSALVAYEGAHQWVERVGMAPDLDPEVRKWQWDLERPQWTGNIAVGGTDPALGFRARHLVRSAWMAEHWGVGYSTSVTGVQGGEDGLKGPGGIAVIDAQLQRTEDFLRSALRLAESKELNGELHPQTFAALLSRHAHALEHLGPSSLAEAQSQYERVWRDNVAKKTDPSRISAKLGDVNARAGRNDDALQWWSRAILFTQNKDGTPQSITLQVPATIPTSPLAQRVLSDIFIGLSALYATSGQFHKAQDVEENALHFLRGIRQPEATIQTSPAQTLHALYILQRSSILSIHLAEVLQVRQQSMDTSIQWLHSAAESSERVARALTVEPTKTGGSATSLLPVYVTSPSMSKPANALLRDAHRTAAEVWNLMGILKEAQTPSQPENALSCYEKALAWAASSTSENQPAQDTLQSDWNVFQDNYSRLKKEIEAKKT